MSHIEQEAKIEKMAGQSRNWIKELAQYREADHVRSFLELMITLVPFVLLWAAAWWALSISYWLTLAISIPAAVFLLRLFMIQHDCGHGAFFSRRAMNDWVGRILGVLTMTPYHVWRHAHAIHHATSGNLDKRGTGDIDTFTVREYFAKPLWRRIAYRCYRHPVVLFAIGPAYLFLLQNRLPRGLMTGGKAYWISSMGTNLAIAIMAGIMIAMVGWQAFLLVHIPIVMLAASIGVWLFYVQHQFEQTFWAEDAKWKLLDAALYGSSHYALPRPLRWLTANIGVHHVHHLASRIPYYRLQQVLVDHPELAGVRRLTLMESFACVKLQLWNEDTQRLISYSEARALQAK